MKGTRKIFRTVALAVALIAAEQSAWGAASSPDPTGTAYLDISRGGIYFTSEGVNGFDSNDNIVTGKYAEYIISGTTNNDINKTIVVESGTHNITFDNLEITAPKNHPFDIRSGASVVLTLAGNNTLRTKDGSYTDCNYAAVHVPEGASLTIRGEGSLKATTTSNYHGAGIGGVLNEISGSITIAGGRVYAESTDGAGIGSGARAPSAGTPSAGTVNITGGTIEARSVYGAGVGAGENAVGPNIYISGGSVKAESTDGGEAVGKGSGNSSCPAPLTGVGGEQVYLATVREAFDDQGQSYIFTIYSWGEEYPYTYSGSGYTADNDNDLYFYLPGDEYPGYEYDVNGSNGRNFSGKILKGEGGDLILYYCESLTLDIGDGPIYFDIYYNETYQYRDPYDPDEKTPICASDNYTITGTYAPNDEYDERPRFGIAVTSISTINSLKITLEDCDISAVSAFRLEENAKVDLVLKGVNTLRSSADAGILVSSGTTLTICSESTGSLFAYGGNGRGEDDDEDYYGNNYKAGAGIGGYDGEMPGEITINGGTITSEGAKGAAGIGGGYGGSAWVRYLTINGGNITAVGHHGAGIGGGQGSICDLTITGGNIIASSDDGAGIGSGKDATYDGTVIITGGTIKATSTDGSGIGGGDCGTIPDIYITGGSIKASSTNGSPIGSNPLTGAGGDPVYLATVLSAYASQGNSYSFSTTKDGSAYSYSYFGTGYTADNDLNLYFYLPNGDYIVEGTNNRVFSGTISNAPGILSLIPGDIDLTLVQGAKDGATSWWGTFYSSTRYTLPEGAAAYTMDGDYHLYRLGEDGLTIPAGKAVIIISDKQVITITPDNGNSPVTDNIPNGDNILHGSDVPVILDSSGKAPIPGSDPEVKGFPYVLSLDTDGVIGFRQYTGDAIPAYKAYYVKTE